MPERGEDGKFMSGDDRSGPRSSSRSRGGGGRYESDGDGRTYGRDGRFGDSESHSEASRRDRVSDYDRDDRSSYRSRGSGQYDDDRYYSNSGESRGSMFNDSEDHSDVPRRGWGGDDDRAGRSSYRSHGGGRYEGEDDDRSYRSSSRGGQGHGQGGWYGDPEGHSRASRRGWEDRR